MIREIKARIIIRKRSQGLINNKFCTNKPQLVVKTAITIKKQKDLKKFLSYQAKLFKWL